MKVCSVPIFFFFLKIVPYIRRQDDDIGDRQLHFCFVTELLGPVVQALFDFLFKPLTRITASSLCCLFPKIDRREFLPINDWRPTTQLSFQVRLRLAGIPHFKGQRDCGNNWNQRTGYYAAGSFPENFLEKFFLYLVTLG